MLVLSRKISEQVYIDVPPSTQTRRIVVTTVDIDRGKIRLGFEADRDIKVMRPELLSEAAR